MNKLLLIFSRLKYLILTLILVIPLYGYSQLSGTYLIGSSHQYTNISQAIDSLNTLGINGSVTFVIDTGIYNEGYIQINKIAGSSSSSTISFIGDTISHNVYFNGQLRFYGASNINIKGITFTSNSMFNIDVVSQNILATCNNLKIENCILIAQPTFPSVSFSNFTNNINNIKLINSQIKGGSYGVLFNNHSNYRYNNISIQGNYFHNQITSSIFGVKIDTISITNNRIYSDSNSTYTEAIKIDNLYCLNSYMLITNNIINLKGNSNLKYVVDFTQSGSTTSCEAIKFYHNTISVEGVGFHMFHSSENVEVINNSFANYGAFGYIHNNPNVRKWNKNAYYSPLKKDFTPFHDDYAHLVLKNSLDSTSFYINPRLDSLQIFNATGCALKGLGQNINSVVVKDINNNVRSNTPSIGANENFNTNPYSGNYNIGTLSNIETISDALDRIYSYGIGGNTTFNVQSGIYREKLNVFPFIFNNNSDSVIFTGTSNNSDVIITTDSLVGNYQEHYLVELFNAKNISFKNMTFAIDSNFTYQYPSAVVGNILKISYGSSNINLINNIFNDNNTGIYSLIYAEEKFTPVNDSSLMNNINISENIFRFKRNGVLINYYKHSAGCCTYYSKNNVFSGNTFISDVCISALNIVGQFGFKATENKFVLKGGRGMVVEFANSTLTTPNLIANNFISVLDPDSNNLNATNGLILYSSSNVDVIHNTVIVNGGTSTNSWNETCPFYYKNIGTNGNLRLSNNILANTNTHSASQPRVFIIEDGSGGGDFLSFESNCYFNSSNTLGKVGSFSFTDLLDLQTRPFFTTFNNNSIFALPSFLSGIDLHLYGVQPTGLDNSISSQVITDIDGFQRPIIGNYMGADQPGFGMTLNQINYCSNDTSNLGQASVIVNNGVSPYTYNWSSGDTTSTASNLSYGTYYITVTDSLSFSIIDSILIDTFPVYHTFLPLIEICNGDSVFLYGNYENTAGVYFDSLQTINGCDSVLSTTLFLNANFNVNQSQSICQGDSVMLGGSYQTIGGVYYDSLQTINGCDSVLSTTLTVNPLPNVTLSNFNPDTICSNVSAVGLPNGSPSGGVYSGTGVSGGTFDPNIAGVGTHNIVYTYTDTNSCINSDSSTIVVQQLPTVILTDFNPDTICSSSSVVALPNGSPSGGVYSGTGVSGGTFDPSTAGLGTHSVIYTYTDTNSCINSDSTFITVEQCVGIDDLANDLGILIYPNPNTGLFTIEKSSELDKEVNISLLDASSRVIIDKLIPKGQQKIEMDITNYSKGVYYLQMTIGDKVYVKQILKN